MSVRVMSLVFGSDLPPTDRLVALALADWSHEDGTRIWPSVATLAAKVGMGTTATRSALRRLQAAGVIDMVRAGGGRHRPSEYRFNPGWINATVSVAFPEAPIPTPTEQEPDGSPTESQRIGVAEPSTPEPSTTEPSEPARAREASITVLPSAFDAFWKVYPRHTGTGAARTAFAKALARAPATEIIAGAVRLRDDPNRDPGFTPHAATWLNQDRWLDDPLPARNGARRDRAQELLDEALEAGYGQRAGEGDHGAGDGVLPGAGALPEHRDGVG